MYHHNILQVNYTTYDVQRKWDTINPNTPHRNIMVLATEERDSEDPYLYARVIGIFHVNVIYTGPGMSNFCPRRVEFLWVWWYTPDLSGMAGGWGNSTLDHI